MTVAASHNLTYENFLLGIIGFGILVDLFSCWLALRRNRRGRGASGLPVVPLIVCYLLPLMIVKIPVLTASLWLDCLLLTLSHVGAVYGVPMLDRQGRARHG